MQSTLPIAVRAWTRPAAGWPPRRAPHADELAANPRVILVFDTETTTDATQRLIFGSWRAFARPDFTDQIEGVLDWRSYHRAGEGLIYADDLPETDPEGVATLRAYASTRPELEIHGRSEWVKEVFHRVAYGARGLVVGFNLPFDISRVAVGVTRSRRMASGFSFVLHTFRQEGFDYENRYRPRVSVRSLDSKRSLIELGGTKDPALVDLWPDDEPDDHAEPEAHTYRGRFLDLRTLAFALTDRSHSLKSACEAFETEHGKEPAEQHGVINDAYIEYNRSDVLATWELYCKLREEYERHPLTLPPTRAYSPASIGKSYLDAMNIRPVLARQPDFPTEVLGYAMSAYYGGRAECRIRRAPVPVVYLDFLSMYPTVNTLMGNWQLLTCGRITTEDATDDVRALVDAIDLEDLFTRDRWKSLACLVKVVPDGDVLPVRARYDQGAEWQIGLNPLTSATPLWYTLADVIAAKLLSGKSPEVLEAIRLVPSDQPQSGLHTVLLRGTHSVDPTNDDFFRKVIELRRGTEIQALPEAEGKRLGDFLKVLANSASYGIFAEVNAKDERRESEVERFGLDAQSVKINTPEEPGRWCFPPLAALIAGGARLMLAMLERCVTDLGGCYAFCDTDSMAIVATRRGGRVRPRGSAPLQALHWGEVDKIVERFQRINPYDPDTVTATLLKVEDENFKPGSKRRAQLYCYAISAKRYCLYNRVGSQLTLRKGSESGLGHLLDPIDPKGEPILDDPDQPSRQPFAEIPRWMQLFWEHTLAEAYGRSVPPPEWSDRPALSQFTVSTYALLEHFRGTDEAKSFARQVKPFNFMLVAHDASIGTDRSVPIAAYERDPSKWLKVDWRDRRSGRSLWIAVQPSAGGRDQLRVVTYGSHFAMHRVHLEAKSLGPDSEPCRRQTSGLLLRRPVRSASIEHIGKEANRLDEVVVGLVAPEGGYNFYEDLWPLVLKVLRAVSIKEARALTGLRRSALMDLRAGRSNSSAIRRHEIVVRVVDRCRVDLGDAPQVAAWSGYQVVSAWLLGGNR